MVGRRIIFFCVLAVLSEQTFGAPLIKTGSKEMGSDDETVGSGTKETLNKELDGESLAAAYLKTYGYLNPGISKNSRQGNELKEGLKRMQRFFNLNVTGELDKETLAIMNTPRCSLPDIAPEGDRLQKRFIPYHIERYSNRVSYKLRNLPSQSSFNSPEEVAAAIDKGFKEWEQHADLYIGESNGSRIDLYVAFLRGYHGGKKLFLKDEIGMASLPTLALSRYPPPGYVYFNDDKVWYGHRKIGYNLEIVATHEMGHTLGLIHSQDSTSIMAPHYDPSMTIGDDDIRGIQYLYGPPRPK